MLNELEALVTRLHECLVSTTQYSDESRSIITDIIYTCGENLSNHTITICLSVFFKREKNLLTFLRRAISRDELRACKLETLQFLHRFISASGKQILPYACDIKDTCLAVFNSDKYSDVRCSTFQVMAKVLELTSGNTEVAGFMNLSKLTEEYFVSMANASKLSSSLKANILVTLGLICRHHPLEISTYSKKCLSLFISTLKSEMNNKFRKPDYNLIAGALEGINNFLSSFNQFGEYGNQDAFAIFDYTKQALLTNTDDLTRYAMPKAALTLLAKYASQFDEYIYDDYKDLFERIVQWAEHKNYELKKLAYLTLDAFYKTMADMLRKKAATEEEKCKKIFKFFIQKFYQNLMEDNDLKETVIAIKGYGAFAGPCKEFMEPNDVKLMFNIIIDICDRTFFLTQKQQDQSQQNQLSQIANGIFDEKIYQLPSFLESLAYVCNQIDDSLPEGSIFVLEKMVVLAIDSYPKLIKRYSNQITLAIAHLFFSIQFGKPNLYADFIGRIVYQSFLRIFSYRTSYSTQQSFSEPQKTWQDQVLDENIEKMNAYNVSCTDYVHFWSCLLNLNEFKELSTLGVHVNEKKKLIEIIYDEILESLIRIMKKLDLTAVKEVKNGEDDSGEGADASSNPVLGLKPLKPRDFEVLINLVDFSRILLNQKNFELFEKWMFKLSKEIIILSSKFTLISGFYKLNTLCMKIAIRIGYFNNIDTIQKEVYFNVAADLNESEKDVLIDENSFSDPNDDPFRHEKLNCFYLYKKFVKDIHVRRKQFKDELLASCLEFLLSMPKELIVHNLSEVFQSLENSLELGISYLPMAESSLSSLEYWFRHIKLSKLKPYYPLVLSKFDDYLQLSKTNIRLDGSEIENLFEDRSSVLKFTYKGKGRKKFSEKLFHNNANRDNPDIYEQIQFRILKILGHLAGEMSHCLFGEINQAKNIIAWDTIQHLKFNMPFVDMKPAIYFDSFLQRIVYLSLYSTSRQTKVNACELLHAIIIYMIGRSVSDPSGHVLSSQFQLNRIYRRVYPALFRLACDVDHFPRNLFQPLCMQMIHWFTGNRKYESLETVELLNCIMDSLVDEKDASLRDFSATALKEFLKWSIKHTPLAKQDSSSVATSVNVKSILKRIFSFLNHPSSSKRLGAAIAWNSIYTIFREEETLVNKHIFELLYYLVESLAMSETDDRMYGTQEHTKLALDHVERIVTAKADMLNQRDTERIKPPGWTESVLEVAVRWLMRQCGRNETQCRHKAMELVYKLAPSIRGITNTKDYFQIKLKTEGELYFIARFEGFSDKRDTNRDSLSNFKQLTDLAPAGHHFQVSFAKAWLTMLIAPLDCYSWVFSEKLLTPSDIFNSNNKSCLWISIQYFIENIINLSLSEVCHKCQHSAHLTCTPNENEEYNSTKCTAIVRFIDFICTMIEKYPREAMSCIPDTVWSVNLSKCFVNLCLNPAEVGFDLNDLDVATNLPLKTSAFFKTFFQHAGISLQNRFKNQLSQIINQNKQFNQIITNIESRSTIKTAIDWLKLSQLISGYEQLNEFNIFHLQLDLTRIVYDYLTRKPGDIATLAVDEPESLTCVDAKNKLLGLCLRMNYNSIRLSKTSDDYLIEIIDKYLFDQTDSGILAYYIGEVSLWMCKRNDQIITYVLNKLKLNFGKCIGLFINLADYLCGDKVQRKAFGKQVAIRFYQSWSLLRDYWQPQANIETKTLLVNLMTKLILIESVGKDEVYKAVTEMYMSLLADEKTKLSFKSKLLDLLCFFCETPVLFSVKSSVGQLVAQFPLRSTELIKGTDGWNDYVNVVRKMIAAFELSKSFELIEVVVNLMCRETEHICGDEIESGLVRCVRRLDGCKQTALINYYWENSFRDMDERKQLIFRKVLMNILRNCEKPSFLEFMCRNVSDLIRILEVDSKEINYELVAANKKCVYELLELSYKRFHKDEIFHSSSKLCVSFETSRFGSTKDGKELTKEVLRKCRKCLAEELKFYALNINSERLQKLNDLQIQLHCAAYNCLVALFIRTQTEPKLYIACLFKDDTSKGELIFEPLIDKKKQYNFSIEVENLQERKTKFISLRNEFKLNCAGEDSSSVKSCYIGSLHSENTLLSKALVSQDEGNSFMNTQNMYESSLSEELGVFDFMNNSSRSHNLTSLPRSSSFTLPGTNSLDSNLTKSTDLQIEIELDDLNQHASMASFVELIQSLVLNKITPIYERGHSPSDMPPWMSFLHRKVSDPYTAENIKFFIIRALINTQEVFKNYAKFWYAPLIGFLVNSSLYQSDKMDYFTLDVMVLLLSWHSVAIPQSTEKKLINRLFENLMRRCYDENRSILKNNLELLKTITECWRNTIEVPVDIILGFLKSVNDPKKLSTGIQLLGVMLTNKIQWSLNVIGDESRLTDEIYRALIQCMRDGSKTIHASAAEVVGIALRNIEIRRVIEMDKMMFDDLVGFLFEILRDMDDSMFITCIHRISLNYPPISERFMSKLLFHLPSLYGDFKLMCSEAILTSIKMLEDPFFKTKPFMEMISQRDSSLQLVCLKMIHELVEKQSEEELLRLLPTICSFKNHSHVACRYQMLRILISIFENYQFKIANTLTPTCLQIKILTNETLLIALLDENQTIRLTAQNFWTDNAYMPSSTIDRMVLILGNMYSTQTESEYLSYSTNLLLEKASKSPDYNRLIYENPLSECTFKDYNLSADWRRRHDMMTPLFVDTINSISDLNDATGTYNPENNLRSTQQQTLQFQATQEIGSGAYNWLTQSNVDTLKDNLGFGGTLSENQSTLLFSVNKKGLGGSKIGVAGGSELVGWEKDQDILRLRRRFLKDTTANSSSRFYARKQIERQNKEESTQKELKQKRVSHVEKYRQYRIGDFPDIQIKYSELIAPIQALAQRDDTIAMILFNDLICSILSEINYLKDATEINIIISSVEKNLNSMLNASESYHPNFIACLLEIALRHARLFQLDSEVISTACLNSSQQSLGVVLLEEYIIIGESETMLRPPEAKRAKLSAEIEKKNKESILWIELAKLYRSMNDYDNIKGVFMKKSDLTTEFTKNGLMHESASDFYNAKKCYMEALNRDWSGEGKRVIKVEEELWEQLMLRCCNELCDWKTMCEWTVEESGGSLQELFERDGYSLEQLFPFGFRAKLKMILQGNIKEQGKHDDLVGFLQSLDADGKKYLEQMFCLEMALVNLHQKDLNAAKYFGFMAIQKYLMEWSAINKTIVQGRMTKLQSLQAIVELNEFLNFVETNQSHTADLNKKIDNLLDLWTTSMPNKHSDPPSTWDDVITNRCIYLEFIEDKYFTTSDLVRSDISILDTTHSISRTADEQQVLKKLEKFKIHMNISFAQAAQCQRNNRLALNKLQQTKEITKNQSSHLNDLQVIWMHCYLETHLARARFVDSPAEKMGIFFGAACLKELRKYDRNKQLLIRRDLNQTQQILHGRFCKFLIENFSEASGYFEELSEKTHGQLCDYVGQECNDLESTLTSLLMHGIQALTQIEGEVCGALELASYCDYFLRLVENDEEETKDSDILVLRKNSILSRNEAIQRDFPLVVVKSILSAMKMNSYEAQQRFPRLLQIVEIYPTQTLESFVDYSKSVPCWMFLSWLSQMTALLDKSHSKSVYHIVEAISVEYPQAFVYPFKMSLDAFKFTYETREQKQFTEKLQMTLSNNSLVSQFIGSLEQLTSPELLYQDFIRELYANLKNRDVFYRLFREMYLQLIEPNNADQEWGNMRKNFSKLIQSNFIAEFGEHGQNITSQSDEEIKQKFTVLSKKVAEYAKAKPTGNLGEYSPWLKRFKRNIAKDLEIPGQYKGKMKPMPEYHVKIESFDERIMVLTSMRRPKCITVRGNDQKDHKFLVKDGEDQRQDQRIETLFELINDLLKADSQCYQRNLSIKTYQVIPMTNKLALIEWLPETKTLKEVIYNARTNDEKKQWDTEARNPELQYHKFIDEASKGIEKWSPWLINDTYGMAFVKQKRDSVNRSFKMIEDLVPSDLLRRFIRSMSTSSEAYYFLRNQFIMSYAVASACHYILGIGDRHLNNWLIDLTTGRAVGIDFGIAFGHATLITPVPELIPIRLTRQILKLYAPLEQNGLFDSSMLHTIRALRENNDLLMCILHVFIKEPSIDWIGNAMRISKKNLDEDMQYSAGVEYAKGRINNVSKKLNGVNPCVITKEDLVSGIHKNSRYLKYFVDAVMGLKIVDETGALVMERSKLVIERGEASTLSCEEQVKCIIEQSMDPGLLGRTWNGWNPYI